MDLVDATRMNKRFAYRQKIHQDLRKRFRAEYLGQLREFFKVRKESHIRKGEVVLVGDSNSKRINWPLAKIQTLYPGKDGKVRVVEVKTKSGSVLRPVQRLYPLEVREQDRVSLPLCHHDSLSSLKEGIQDIKSISDEMPKIQNEEIRRSRYGRILKPVQRDN